eukprot:gene26762-4339_t
MQMIWEQFMELQKYTYSQEYLGVFDSAARIPAFNQGRCIFRYQNQMVN